MRRAVIAVVVLVLLLALAMWSSDFITLQGERTVFTADCAAGTWKDEHCTGQLRAGKRYRFRALKAHDEVIFWTSGAREASGKFSGCQIASGRHWRCPPNGTESTTVTLQMDAGAPVVDPRFQTIAFHPISKWRWYLLSWNLPAGSDAEAPQRASAP
jgi:hypothetical protein